MRPRLQMKPHVNPTAVDPTYGRALQNPNNYAGWTTGPITLVGAPTDEGVSGRALLQATADNDLSDEGMGGKVAGLVQYKAGRFDA